MLTLNTMNFYISTNYFCAQSPRAEMHMKINISPSREYDPESTVPLAGMQSKFYIPASGDFVIISVHRPRELRCTWKFTCPPRGNTIRNRQFRLRECNQNFTSPQAEICNYFLCTVPASGDAHENLHFPLAGILSSADNSACGNATKI